MQVVAEEEVTKQRLELNLQEEMAEEVLEFQIVQIQAMLETAQIIEEAVVVVQDVLEVIIVEAAAVAQAS
jgi:hypothetical protein